MIKILLVEDSPDDAEIAKDQLAEPGAIEFQVKHVEFLEEACRHLRQEPYDVVLLDLSLPDGKGLSSLSAVLEENCLIPIVVLTSLEDEELAIQVVREGGQDYLVKGNCDGALMKRSIRYAIERKEAEKKLYNTEEHLRTVVQNMPVMLMALDTDKTIVAWNQECERITGYTKKDVLGDPQAFSKLFPDSEYRTNMMDEWTKHGNAFEQWEWRVTCKDSSVRSILWSSESEKYPIPGWESWLIGTDITERRLMEEALWVVQLVAEGATALSPSITQGLMSWLKKSSAETEDKPRQDLSPQQEKILAFIAEGKTNKEIAQELNLSDKTVRNHIAVLFTKLQISRRAQAAAFFAKQQ